MVGAPNEEEKAVVFRASDDSSPARTFGRFFRVKRCFSAQVDILTDIDYSPAGTTSFAFRPSPSTTPTAQVGGFWVVS